MGGAPGNGTNVNPILSLITGTANDPNPGPGPNPPSGVASVLLQFQRVSDGKWWNFFTEQWTTTQVSSSPAGTCDHYFPISKTTDSLTGLFQAMAGTISRGQLTQ